VRLDEAKQPEMRVLVAPEGKVQLNEAAVTILRLCNGSRTREDIVAEVTQRPHGSALAADVSEFLDAARARGWTVEA
jgi:pyrroloquinoline quinone biosynthesis protein D